MEERRQSNVPSDRGLPAGYSTVRPHHTRESRPVTSAFGPSATAAASPSTPAAADISPVTGSGQYLPLPQKVLDAYPQWKGKTREEVWRSEVNDRNMWLESLRVWIQEMKEAMKKSAKNSMNAELNIMVTDISNKMEELLPELMQFRNQLNVAEACIEYDEQRQQDQLREFRNNFRLPSFRPPTLPGSVAPSDSSPSLTAFDLIGVSTAARRPPSAATNSGATQMLAALFTSNRNEDGLRPDPQETANPENLGTPNETPGATTAEARNTGEVSEPDNENRQTIITIHSHQTAPSTAAPSTQPAVNSATTQARPPSIPSLFTTSPPSNNKPEEWFYQSEPPPPGMAAISGRGLGALATTAASRSPSVSPTHTAFDRPPWSEVRLAHPNNPDQPFLVRSSDGILTSGPELILQAARRQARALTPSPRPGSQAQSQGQGQGQAATCLGDNQQEQQPATRGSQAQGGGATPTAPVPHPSQDQRRSTDWR